MIMRDQPYLLDVEASADIDNDAVWVGQVAADIERVGQRNKQFLASLCCVMVLAAAAAHR